MPDKTFIDDEGDKETLSYEETDRVPRCTECTYRYNYTEVAPCRDCTGYYETGRSYFKQGKWKEA
jgi:hypothetical protein